MRLYQSYKVSEGFPSVVPDILDKGISEVTYSLDLNVCTDYKTDWNSIIAALKGGISIG